MGVRARWLMPLAAALTLLVPRLVASQGPAAPAGDPARFGAETYRAVCAGCHGTDLAGGRGPSLFDPRLLAALDDRRFHDILVHGIPGSEMPAFGGTYSDDQLYRIIAYVRTQAGQLEAQPAFVPDPAGLVVRSEKQAFRIEVVAKDLDTPWGLAFLPDGRLLVTERAGRLRLVGRDGKMLPAPVRGTPPVWVRQDGGMLDVAVHPDYPRNGLIYLAYTEVAPGHVVTAAERAAPAPGQRTVSPPSMTVLIRGRLTRDNRWVTDREIFRAPTAVYTASGSHYGARFLFDRAGHLFFTLGERGDMTNAQRLDTPLGKIHRVNDDGSVPADNPFVHTAHAIPTIWSYGHRNPEGLAFDPATGVLWESEHGPTGGDEINVIDKGGDYGWGVVSMGVQPGIGAREAPGMIPPVAWYTPSIGPSGIGFYTGDRYPGWRGSLFVAGLVGQQLRRLEVSGRTITHQEVVFAQLGRTRAMATGPDGLLYVLLQNPTGRGTGLLVSDATPGMVVKLVPVG